MKKQAFTLIELLIIMAVVGVLSTVVMTNIGNARAKALNAKRANDLDTMYKALKLYYTGEKNVVPDKFECRVGEAGCLDELVEKGYIKSLPLGPNGKCNANITLNSDSAGECYFYTWDTQLDSPRYAIVFTKMNPPQAGSFRSGVCIQNYNDWYCLGFKTD